VSVGLADFNKTLPMKKNASSLFRFPGLALMLLIGFCAGKVSAQIYAQDDAAGYTNSAGGNFAWEFQSTTNGGFGFQPWVFQQAGPTFHGFYIGKTNTHASATLVGSTNGNFWGMYANAGTGNGAVAFRAFSNSLPVNAVFKIKWRSDGISPSDANAAGGFCLRNGNANGSTNDWYTSYRLIFYYVGAGADSFLIYDGSGVTATGIGFGSNPFQIEVTLLTIDTYRLVIKDATGGTTLAVFDNMTLAGSGTIDSVSLFEFDTGGDQIFNNLSISSTSLVPPDSNLVAPTNGTIYWPSASGLSFNVVSAFSTVSSNNIKLYLNGASRTNLSFAGSGTTNVQVTLNSALQDNIVYTGVITASDANGNSTTNNFSFNTWLTSPYNLYIEAEDYNYSSGGWIDNFLAPQPNQAYAGLLGSNGVDYLEYDLSGTNNAYRPGDLPQVEICTDQDHNNFTNNSFQDYDLAYIQNGEWEDYTRRMSNLTYTVYARMAGFGDNPVMLMERLASPTVTSSNQPRASLGTFVCPNTGGAQNWTFVQLKDFFSNPVQVRLPGTNTLRLTCIGSDGNYNVNYLILVPSTNTAVLRPYLASGFPYPGAGGVNPDQNISFVIANSSTNLVVPGSIQLFLNSTSVTSGIVVSNNAAGAGVSYQPPALMSPGTNTLLVIYSDGLVSLTNQWQFTVAALTIIPPAYALPVGSAAGAGFTLQIAKADDGSTNVDFPPSVARAEAQLAGTLTNSITGLPYTNEALNSGNYTETNVINYAIDPLFYGIFSPTNLFPDLPAGGTNDVAMAALMYVQLSPGAYSFGVYSDDGFQFSAGPTPVNTNLVLGVADYGRAAAETAFSFIVQTNGLYPMRLLYFKSQFNGGGVELYSINRSNGTRILLNDPANPNSIKVYYAIAPALYISQVGINAVLTWSDASYSLQAAPLVTGTYTNVTGAVSPYTTPATGAQRYFRLKKP
jgi:hypothetical protein